MRTKSETRREAILVAAKAVFEEVGFEQATMSEITARVGGSKATLYRYFDSKDALFQALLRRAAAEHCSAMFALLQISLEGSDRDLPQEAAEVLAMLNPEADVASVLQVFGEKVLRVFHTPKKFVTRRMVIAAANDSDVGKLFYENGPMKAMQHIACYFEAAMNAGSLRQADAQVAAHHFRALLHSEVDEAGLMNVRPVLSDEEIRAVVARAVDVFMRAYSPDPTPSRRKSGSIGSDKGQT